MNQLSVEMKVDIWGHDGLPHSFLFITGPDGQTRGCGFSPAEPGKIAGLGVIKNNIDHDFSAGTGKIPLDINSYNRLVDYVNNSIKNPPPYQLIFGSQCANWAINGLAVAGVLDYGIPNMEPDNPLRDIGETIFSNPYLHWIDINVSAILTKTINWIDAKVADFFIQSRDARPIDPLAIDLDGDGIEAIPVNAAASVLFDHDGDGTRTGTGWLKGDDGWLVLDRNGNGQIDNGGELFGMDTTLPNARKATDGFAALASLDSNQDKVFDVADVEFARVQIWRDLNQDGVSDAGELQSLSAAGIASISLTSVSGRTQLNGGNVQTASALFTRTDGSIGKVANIDLVSNAFFREFASKIPVSAEASALPNIRGSGMVGDLREAATRNPDLNQQVNSFKGLSRAEVIAKVDHLLGDWAATANFMTTRECNDPVKTCSGVIVKRTST